MYFGFPCQLESTSRVVSCKVRVTLSSHAFSRVCGYVVYMTFIGSSVFRTLNKVKRKKKLCLTVYSLQFFQGSYFLMHEKGRQSQVFLLCFSKLVARGVREDSVLCIHHVSLLLLSVYVYFIISYFSLFLYFCPYYQPYISLTVCLLPGTPVNYKLHNVRGHMFCCLVYIYHLTQWL